MTKTLFITATGTHVGKTYVTQLLIRQLKAQGHSVQAIKPVISGFTSESADASDSGMILQELGQDLTSENIDKISPWRFAAPLSPDVAAKAEGQTISFKDLIHFCQQEQNKGFDYLIIEGVGGLMVPLDETHTCLDWMAALEADVILVAGTYLGCISHILTANACLAHKDIEPKKIILSQSLIDPVKDATLLSSLRNFLPESLLRFLPREDLGHIRANLPPLI